MASGLSLANKCQLLFGVAVVVLLSGVLVVPWFRSGALVEDAQLEIAQSLADTVDGVGPPSEGQVVRVDIDQAERSDDPFIKQALDIGAAGIIVPQVNTAEQAESVVRFAKYSPEGMRGVGLARAHGYGMDFAKYINNANHDTAVIVQAEHAEAVKNIDAIVKVEGVDAVLVGPYDLSASLGKIGQVEDPEVVHAISQVTEACAAASMPLGLFAVAATSLEPYIKRGYTLLVSGVDTLLLSQAETSLLNEVKGLIGSR